MDSDVVRAACVVPVIVRARALGQGDTVSHAPRLAVARVSENFAGSILHTAARSARDVDHAMSGNQNAASGEPGGCWALHLVESQRDITIPATFLPVKPIRESQSSGPGSARYSPVARLRPCHMPWQPR